MRSDELERGIASRSYGASRKGVAHAVRHRTSNSESFDSIASRALTLAPRFCDLCRGLPAHSIREEAAQR
jgi:hypothetical protein